MANNEEITFLPFPSITTPVTELNEFHSRLSEEYSVLFAIQTILSEVCEKEPARFRFINEAFHEYMFGQSGFIKKYNRWYKLFDNISSELTEGASEEYIGLGHKVKFLIQCKNWEKEAGENEDSTDTFAISGGPDDISNALIYEIINVFNIDFSPGQAFTKFIPGLSRTLHILSSLCENIMSVEIQQPTENEKSKEAMMTEPSPRHLHMEPLDSSTGQIRILKILRGTDEDIRCSLEERNLYRDGIEIALSYVWGKSTTKRRISVNDVPFDVTENLYEILHNLRNTSPCQDLYIWVDAICINQANDTEKMHQVRLMRDIYTEARQTIVWLGDTSDQISESDTKQKQDEVDSPLITKFDKTGLHQYDLCAILSVLKECPLLGEFIEKKLALHIMLWRCIQEIFLQEWWERIWTIQEAALPRSSPIFYFKGNQFSFADLTVAMNMIEEFSKYLGETLSELENTPGYARRFIIESNIPSQKHASAFEANITFSSSGFVEGKREED
ncbi:heterokaryon incompatibility protein-domain-containing protein [Daldinia loculata]|nr:heterokaryon incompatibility protein-domain-containing protein [Daldinia loculata]